MIYLGHISLMFHWFFIGNVDQWQSQWQFQWQFQWQSQPGTSHVTFRHPNGAKLTVPARRPIKPIYIKKFVRLVDEGVGE